MNALAGAISSGDAKEIVRLLGARLRGDQLDSPINRAANEAPRDLVVQLYKEPTNRAALDSAIDSLSTRDIAKTVRALSEKGEPTALPNLLLEFFALVSDTRSYRPDSKLGATCREILALRPANGAVKLVQLAAFRAIASSSERSGSLAGYLGGALVDIEVAREICRFSADVAPRQFLEDIAPPLLARHSSSRALDPDTFSFLTPCLRMAISALLSEGKEPLENGLQEFLDRAADQAPHHHGARIRRAVVAALSQSRVPMRIIQLFERKYWNRLDDIVIEQDQDLDHERLVLRGRVLELPTLVPVHPITITVNPIPYAEAGYFELWALLLKIGYDIDIHFHLTPYNTVLSALTDGKLQLAIHNSYFLSQKPLIDKNNPLLASPPLIKFERYEGLVSRRRLEREIVRGNLKPDAADLAKLILRGNVPLGASGAIEHPGLAPLIEMGKIAYWRNTDTEVAATALFGKHNSRYVHNCNSDEGLRRLLDEEVLFYVGGALQAHYALNSCPNRVLKLSDINRSVDVHFFIMKNVYMKDPGIYNHCIYLWRMVAEFWDELVDVEIAHRELGALYREIRKSICFQINRGRALRSGFAPSFSELAGLLDRHDTLLDAWRESEFSAVSARPSPRVPPAATSGVASTEQKDQVLFMREKAPRNGGV